MVMVMTMNVSLPLGCRFCHHLFLWWSNKYIGERGSSIIVILGLH